MERWATVNENPNYEVSDIGRVRNKRTGKTLIPRQNHSGYQRVHIKTLTGRDLYIHRLVADAFCDHPNGCDVINHKDNNPKNNNASNLEWTTPLENVHYGMRQGRFLHNAREVIGSKDGTEYRFISAHQAGKYTGCDHSMIIKCCKGKNKMTHGFTWRYAEVL